MIPLWATIQIGKFRLWLPLLFIWILLAPVVLLLTPLVAIALLAVRVNPIKTFGMLWNILRATRGTLIEVIEARETVLIQIH